MAQTGYTPISIYYSDTPTTAPVGTNLVYGELALNIVDGKLYYKDASNNVQLLAAKGGILPDQAGNAGKYLTTNGSVPSWATIQVAAAGGAIVTNTQTATESYTFPVGTNGFSVGPVNTAPGVTVVVTAGQRWLVV